MRSAFLLPALAIAVAAPVAGFAAKPVDWARRVTLSPTGGHLLGNPAAKTKVVEYVSYTCSHCAEFVKEGTPPLTARVRTGQLNVEVRNAVRDPFDLTAALLARCGGKDRFMGNHDALFANFDAWMAVLPSYTPPSPPLADRPAEFRDIAQKTGLYTLMGKRGFTSAQLDACLADPASLKQILAMTDDAWNTAKIGGTPGLFVNGTQVKGGWPALQAALPASPK